MDKRTLLAFVLIFLILIGSQFVMKSMTGSGEISAPADSTAIGQELAQTGEATRRVSDEGERYARDERLDSEREDAVTGEIPRESMVEGDDEPRNAREALELLDDGNPETTVTVVTPLYTAEISTRGASIVSFLLNEHTDFEGNPLQLIPTGEEAAGRGADRIEFAAGDLDLSRALFVYTGPGVVNVDQSGGTYTVEFAVDTASGLTVRKSYLFDSQLYNIEVSLDVVTSRTERAASSLAFLGQPETIVFGWNQGIATTERALRTAGHAFRSFAQVGDDLHFRNRSDLAKNADKVEARFTDSAVRFAGLQNKYFTVVGVVSRDPAKPVVGGITLSGDRDRNQQTWAVSVPARASMSENGRLAHAVIDLYVGPQEQDRLEAFGLGLEDTMDMGWALFRPLSEAVLWIMEFMHRFISNYGVIIILFSVLTKILFYPLTRKSTQSMKRMQEMQPKIKALQEKYKDNREKQSQAMMELYKEEKINPMAGCLPLLVQSPVFIALYQALMHTIALRNTPFVGWIRDLSQPDAMFTLPVALPFMGSDFNLLPILMSASMYIQTKITPTGAAGGQMALMNTMLPVMMLVFFYQMPSGLVIYWLVNTLMTIYQTWRIHKAAPATGGAVAA